CPARGAGAAARLGADGDGAPLRRPARGRVRRGLGLRVRAGAVRGGGVGGGAHAGAARRDAQRRAPDELRAGPRRRRARAARATGAAGPRRHRRHGPSGHQLDPRARHEPAVRPRDDRRADERRLHRDRAEPRIQRRVHARAARRAARAVRPARGELDGQARGARAAHRSRARTVRPVLRVAPAARGGVRVPFPRRAERAARPVPPLTPCAQRIAACRDPTGTGGATGVGRSRTPTQNARRNTDQERRAVNRLTMHIVALAGVFTLLACQASPPPAADGEWAGTVATLPSGRLVVRNPDAPLWRPGEAWELRERFRLGAMDGDGADVFGSIVDVELGPDGTLYVLDAQASEVRAFGSDGVHLRTIGRKGRGQGEFNRAVGMAFDAHCSLWVIEWGYGR